MTQPFEKEYQQLMQSIVEKSMRFLSEFGQKKEVMPADLQNFIDLTREMQSFSLILLKNPEKLWKMQIAYWQDAIRLSNTMVNAWLQGKPLPMEDKRFSETEWVNNPFFNLLSHHYLLASEHLTTLLTQLDYGDQPGKKRVQFFAKQFLDALSPSNFLSTNPKLMAETLQSHGENLIRGLENFMTDLDSGSSRLNIKMTDMDAFKIGENIAITPGKVIFRNDIMELIQYTPQTKQVRAIPLLIIPPWINKYYVLDLSKDNSFVNWIVQEGISVFIISWVNPDRRHANKGLAEYIQEGPMAAIEIIQKQLQVEKVNTLGFCIGGTALACLLAYYQNRSPSDLTESKNPIRSATFLASLIDFSEPGDIGVFIDEKQVQELEKKMAQKGYLDGSYMTNTFNSLRANDLIWSFFVKNYLEGQNPIPFDLLYWNADATNMAAKIHSEYLRQMYLQNDLIKPGKITLFNTPLDVHKITTTSFFVSTMKDHIAPWESTYSGFALFKGKKQFLLGDSGHIAGIVNPPYQQKYGYYLNQKIAKTAKGWLEKASYHKGSWWPVWLAWLLQQSGDEIRAPVFKKLPIKPLMDAPGSYVLVKNKEPPS